MPENTNHAGSQMPGNEELIKSECQESRADQARKGGQDIRPRRSEVRRSLKYSVWNVRAEAEKYFKMKEVITQVSIQDRHRAMKWSEIVTCFNHSSQSFFQSGFPIDTGHLAILDYRT